MLRNGCIVLGAFLFFIGYLSLAQAPTTAHVLPAPTPTTITRLASPAELAMAQAEWAESEHSATYDEGMGANTTCARCKSPLNYDPSQDAAAQLALDCGSCKRIPGQPRPELAAGERVGEREWRDIPCDVCHIPVGDSYDVGIAFWNQSIGAYQAMGSAMELCSQCHEGQHGFEVVEEQRESLVHTGMDCTDCHGAHGAPSACTDCHDPDQGAGAMEHARHINTNCTGCHDAGRLSIWYEEDPDSQHFGQYITRRFAHTLTSWPSHNLTRQVDCLRCHHPAINASTPRSAVAAATSCNACHQHEEGVVHLWCTYFLRNPDPHEIYNQPANQP